MTTLTKAADLRVGHVIRCTDGPVMSDYTVLVKVRDQRDRIVLRLSAVEDASRIMVLYVHPVVGLDRVTA
jgi:hypothetical protein